MHLRTYLGLADHAETTLADSLRVVADGHARDAEVHHTARVLARLSDQHRTRLGPVVDRYGEADPDDEPDRLRGIGLDQHRAGEVGLLRDLQDLQLLATLVRGTWTVLAQAAQALRDDELRHLATESGADTDRQLRWLLTQLKTVAPQTLLRS